MQVTANWRRNQGLAEWCDVFCETGVFTPEESRRILDAGTAHGLKARIHADELGASGGSLVGNLPLHPPFYPLDVVSEHPERFFVGEIIREKIFEQFRDEIPYSTTVDIIDFIEQSGRKDLIRAEIYVERDSQKGILIGKQGKALREIGEQARADIETFLGRKVFLELHVKVREKWRGSDAWLKRLGYH